MPLDITTAFEWTAEVRPMFDQNGNEVDSNIGRLITRSDDGTPLAVAGPNFAPIQHQDVVAPVLEALRETGITEFHRREKFGATDLYDLKGKSGAFIQTIFSKNGGIMRTIITTGNFIAPTGPSSFLPDGPPTCFQEYHILNSHTGTYSAQVDMRYRNIVCMNGLVRDNFHAAVRAKHTTKFNLDAFRAKIMMGAELMQTDTERFELYVKTELKADKAKELFMETIARLGKDPEDETKWVHSEALVKDLLERFAKEPQTVWGAYMAMTEWATHGSLKENSDVITARVTRDQRVSAALRSRMFKRMLEAA